MVLGVKPCVMLGLQKECVTKFCFATLTNLSYYEVLQKQSFDLSLSCYKFVILKKVILERLTKIFFVKKSFVLLQVTKSRSSNSH